MYQYRYQNIFCVQLAQFKKDVSKLEREISIKIQENQMKQHEVADEITIDLKPASVIKIDTKGTKSLLPKKQVGEGDEDLGLQ